MLVAPVGSARPASLVCKLPAALWRYRRYAVDNRPWCGPGYPAAAYIYSEDRKGVHPAEHLKGYSGLLQVDGYAGFADLVDNPAGEPPQLAFCVAHARRKSYDVFVATKSPIAEEALQRIAALYLIESDLRGKPATERQRVRDRESRPLVEAMYVWLKEQLGRIPGGSGLPQAIRYALNHWRGLTLFLDDGRLELDSNTVERSIRPITITRKNALFGRSSRR
jgi:transposase